MKKQSRNWRLLAVEAVALAGIICAGYFFLIKRPKSPSSAAQQVKATDIESMVAEEELILALSPRLKKLDRALLNLSLPDRSTREIFTDEVVVSDLAPGDPPAPDLEIARSEIEERHWHPAEESARLAGDSWRLLTPLMATVDHFEHGHFYFIDAHLTGEQKEEIVAKSGLGALARKRDGGWRTIKATFEITWRYRGSGPRTVAENWQIAGWKVVKFATQDAPRKLFTETLDRVLPNPADRVRARECLQEQYNIRLVKDPQFVPPHPMYFVHADDKHPGLSVIDIDADGWDDLYVMDLWGRNLLLHNRGDGTFQDVAPQYGLDLRDNCSCAVFADFDNDGDPDAFIGRTQARSLYLENQGGRFVDRGEALVGTPLPYFVSSINAVDINNDGLLDVYFSTYAGNQILRTVEGRNSYQALLAKFTDKPVLSEYLSPDDAANLGQLVNTRHVYLDRAGPPNLLLVNRSGRFAVASDNAKLQAWRNTYQSSWCDYDEDGDQDCYVSNDYAPDNLFRNDGQGIFTDVAIETGTDDGGFGMGGTWGDYDEDGRQDLYVSNMFSKAGRRITGKLGNGLDERLAIAARGNTLFRNEGATFQRVSGQDPPAQMVESAGWSWGSQFVDVDSDGYLDIFALSGFYSAPREIAIELDL